MHERLRRLPLSAVLLLGAGVAGAIVVSGTRAFTLPADVAVAVLIAAVWALAVVPAPWRRSEPTPQVVEQDGIEPAAEDPVAKGGWRAALPWLVLLAVVVGWELFCYVASPRSAHPTFSSITDSLDRWRLGKLAVCGLWLALGARLATWR